MLGCGNLVAFKGGCGLFRDPDRGGYPPISPHGNAFGDTCRGGRTSHPGGFVKTSPALLLQFVIQGNAPTYIRWSEGLFRYPRSFQNGT
eukprot:4139928-Prymnesium_polylepis.1